MTTTRGGVFRTAWVCAALLSLGAFAQQGTPPAAPPDAPEAGPAAPTYVAPPPPPDVPEGTPPPPVREAPPSGQRSRLHTSSPPTPKPTSHRILSVRLSLLSGVPDVAGLSVALTALKPLELEAGVSTVILTFSTYVRGGVAFPLIDDREADGRGTTLFLPVLVGYRHLDGYALLSSGVSRYDGVNAVAGLEGTVWFAPHFGLELQLLLGGMYWIVGPTAGSGPLFPDVRLSIGLAF